ncbi:MAG: YcxB family protein, partial [Tepidisphaeraceae bacterium]
VGFQETKTLILLLASQSTGLYIPKRAFNGDEELNAMRALSELMPKPDAAAFLLEPTVDPSPAAPPISAWDALPPH